MNRNTVRWMIAVLMLLALTVSVPLADHTVQTLKNLICTIYSRGALLSKATGGEFFADKTMTDAALPSMRWTIRTARSRSARRLP